MNIVSNVTLKISSILDVPFDNYPKDFTFIVNNETFQTNKLIADLLSKKISRLHISDPMIDQYEIRTHETGNFQTILDLIKNDHYEIQRNELPFFAEIFETLELNLNSTNIEGKLTVDDVLDRIKVHEHSRLLFSDVLNTEIEFAATNFSSLKNQQEDKLMSLSFDTLEQILHSSKLKLNNENELLEFINHLYTNDTEYSKLYDCVLFSNVNSSGIEEFLSIFHIEDINISLWNSISTRLKQTIENPNCNFDRYKGNLTSDNKRVKHDIPYQNKEFEGIFNYFQQQSNINNEVKLTASSEAGGCDLRNLLKFGQTNYFYTNDLPNSWICFEFINHFIIPTHYTLKSEKSNGVNGRHPKSWVIEVSNNSNDANGWITIDTQRNNSSLNGSNYVHTFSIKNKVTDRYKFIRIRQTDKNFHGNNLLLLDSIEFYGQIYTSQ